MLLVYVSMFGASGKGSNSFSEGLSVEGLEFRVLGFRLQGFRLLGFFPRVQGVHSSTKV